MAIHTFVVLMTFFLPLLSPSARPFCLGTPIAPAEEKVSQSFFQNLAPKLRVDHTQVDAPVARTYSLCSLSSFNCFLCKSCTPFYRMLKTPPRNSTGPGNSPQFQVERPTSLQTSGFPNVTESADIPPRSARPFSSMTCAGTPHYKYFKEDDCFEGDYSTCGCERRCSWDCYWYINV